MPNQKYFAAQEKDLSALGGKAETMRFVAKIWGVYSCAHHAISTRGKDPSAGTSKKDGRPPSLEAFKPWIDKATATLTSCWDSPAVTQRLDSMPLEPPLPPNLGGFWENNTTVTFLKARPFLPGALHAG